MFDDAIKRNHCKHSTTILYQISEFSWELASSLVLEQCKQPLPELVRHAKYHDALPRLLLRNYLFCTAQSGVVYETNFHKIALYPPWAGHGYATRPLRKMLRYHCASYNAYSHVLQNTKLYYSQIHRKDFAIYPF